MIRSVEGWPTKAKEAPSPHEVRLTPLDNVLGILVLTNFIKIVKFTTELIL